MFIYVTNRYLSMTGTKKEKNRNKSWKRFFFFSSLIEPQFFFLHLFKYKKNRSTFLIVILIFFFSLFVSDFFYEANKFFYFNQKWEDCRIFSLLFWNIEISKLISKKWIIFCALLIRWFRQKKFFLLFCNFFFISKFN